VLQPHPLRQKESLISNQVQRAHLVSHLATARGLSKPGDELSKLRRNALSEPLATENSIVPYAIQCEVLTVCRRNVRAKGVGRLGLPAT
jgi:hypothetical protein